VIRTRFLSTDMRVLDYMSMTNSYWHRDCRL